MNSPFKIVLYVLIVVFVVAIGSVVIKDGSVIAANIGEYIIGLFEIADIRPGNNRGFNCLIQLVIIAVAVGWAIDRYKKYRKSR